MVNWDDDGVFENVEGVSFLNDLPEEPAPVSILIDDGTAAATVEESSAETRVVHAPPPVKTG